MNPNTTSNPNMISYLSESWDKLPIINANQKYPNFATQFNHLNEEVDSLLNDNPYFTTILPSERGKQRVLKNSFLLKNKFIKKPNLNQSKIVTFSTQPESPRSNRKNNKYILSTDNSVYSNILKENIQQPELLKGSKSATNTLQIKASVSRQGFRRMTAISPQEKEWYKEINKNNYWINSPSNTKTKCTTINSPDSAKVPLILKRYNKNLQTLLIENKDIKENDKRHGVLLTSVNDINQFIKALKEKEWNDCTTLNDKEFQSNLILNKFLKQGSTLRQIYSKCIKQIRNGEEIDKFITYNKRKSDENSKIENKKYQLKLLKLQDKALIEDAGQPKKQMRPNLTHEVVESIRSISNDNEYSRKQKLWDLVPSMSANLAFQNRNYIWGKLDYNYGEDNDFLFVEDYNKLKQKHKCKKEIEVIESFRGGMNNDIQYIMDKAVKDKDLLIKRIDDNRVKYKKNGYFCYPHSDTNVLKGLDRLYNVKKKEEKMK